MRNILGVILISIGWALIIFVLLYIAYLIHWTVCAILTGFVLWAIGDELI